MTTDPAVRYALLVYDIPEASGLSNPSGLMRRFAVRINLSCWVLPLKNLPLLPVREWVEKGASVEVVEFDEGEREKVVALARRALQREVEEMRRTVEASVAKVRERYAGVKALGTGTTERSEALDRAGHYAYLIGYRAKALADAAEECALHFDLTGDVAPLVGALRKTIKAKAAIFFDLYRDAKGEPTPEPALPFAEEAAS